jgi:ditrans,polycis-polyprenyl diphosphate synthase
MDLMKAKIEELLTEESLLRKFDARIIFWGNLELLTEPVLLAARKAMDITSNNKGSVLSVCVAYTSTNEITRAIEASVNEMRENAQITMSDLERHMYTAGCVQPDIIIRTSGET